MSVSVLEHREDSIHPHGSVTSAAVHLVTPLILHSMVLQLGSQDSKQNGMLQIDTAHIPCNHLVDCWTIPGMPPGREVVKEPSKDHF